MEASSVRHALQQREAELADIDRQLAAAPAMDADRLALSTTCWVQQQLEDLADVLRDSPERVRAHFQKLNLKITLYPVHDEGDRPFLRAIGEGDFAPLCQTSDLNFPFTGQTPPSSE